MSGQSNGGAPLEVIRLVQERAASLAQFLRDLKDSGDEAFFSPHGGDAGAIREMLGSARRDLYYLVVEGERVLAYGLLRGWDEGFAIPSLGIAVHPAVKGVGLGRLLMDFLHLAAARRGADKIRLRVHRDNVKAIALYRSLGYEIGQDAQEPDYLLGFKTLRRKNAA